LFQKPAVLDRLGKSIALKEVSTFGYVHLRGCCCFPFSRAFSLKRLIFDGVRRE
jgi:hypothetical protein